MSVNATNIILEPCDVLVGRREKNTITFDNDDAGDLNSKYFLLNDTHYVWININGAGVDPMITGRTGIEVIGATNAVASILAGSASVAINAVEGFNAINSGAVLSVENDAINLGSCVDGDTGFTIENIILGMREDLGATSGGVSISPEVTKVDVKIDQMGETLLDQIENGTNVSISMSLSEVTAENWSLIVGKISGDEITPTNGTKLVGFGESKRFKNLAQYSLELLLKPSNSSDDLRNVTFWKTIISPSSVNFSGSDLQVMEVEFMAIRDANRNSEINLFCFGDSKQNTLI